MLGAKLGIETSKLGRYESGEHLPPHLTLIRIADAFAISLDVLMGRRAMDAPRPGDGAREPRTPTEGDRDA